jgi:hypothetical protein
VPGGDSGVHTPARQNLPVPHDASVVQPSQAVAPQIPGAQSCVRTAGHEPDPSQEFASVATLFVQLGGRHCLLGPGIVHDCVVIPSQAPSHPVPSPMHATLGDTGVPVTAVHVPSLPVRLHASHWPEQLLLQHTASAQKLDWHWPPLVHFVPGGPLLVHCPPESQKFPSTQSASAVQVVLHAVVPQT